MWLSKLVNVLVLSAANAQRIAVIGGGISGSFVSKYLVDYDEGCKLNITIFEPTSTMEPVDSKTSPDGDWQGSRVASVKLEDGSVVELGASIGYKDFHLVLDMIRGDPDIEMGKPFNTGGTDVDEGLRKGLGIYSGGGEWNLLTSQTAPSFFNKFRVLYRYNYDLIRVSRACKQALHSFASIPLLLDSDLPGTFFDSPDDIWQSIGLLNIVHSSFDQLLDVIGLTNELSWWRRFLPFQGLLRNELLTAINLVNYNQDNSQVNGLVGLGSFAASTGGLFSVRGGNYKIMKSAVKQAIDTSNQRCGRSVVNQVAKRVTIVVGGLEGLTLYTDSDTLGTFDIVILAAPLQQSRIQFLVQSHFDEAVLQPMPLAGLINTDEQETDEGHQVLPERLPDSAIRPYTQVVTTVVSNATLNAEYFSLPDNALPRSVCMTTAGKAALHNITAISQIASSGLYKIFSDKQLEDSTMDELFGQHHRVEYVKVWGGPHGGATPDYRGQGTATNFLLYDGATGLEGHTFSGALYYPSAMEQSSLACMELSAIGARAIAKLTAKRIGLIESRQDDVRDEL